MITIYKKDEADFTHRGLGTLPDATEAEVQEIINGIFDLRVTYPKDGRKADLLQEERIIKASTPKGDQLFRIYKIRKDLPYIEAHALHKFYDLSDNFIEDTFIQNKGGQAALQQLLDMSILPHNFSAVSDVPGPMNLRIVRYNTVAAIMGDEEENTLLKRGGGEIERDNLVIRWKQRLGEDRGVKIKYRKNLLGLDFESDYSTVVTKIMPQGFDGLFIPEKYVESPRINDYHMPKIQKREYPVISAEKNPDEEGAIPHDQALAKLRTLAVEEFSNGLDLPSISCFVDFIDLAQTAEYKEYQVLERIYIGDTIHVIYPEQNIELSARMTMYTWDALKHRYNTMFVGTMKNELQSAISAGEKALVKAEEVQQSMMEKAREVATALINSGFGGHVRIHPDKVLIMDTEDESTAQKVWQWNINGLGYSETGINGPYGTAMVDGMFLGERITAGSITVNQVAADFGQSIDLSSNVAITSKVDQTDYDTETGRINQQLTEMEQRADALEIAVQDGGGLNLVLNSAGYAGLDFWEKSGEIEPLASTWILSESTAKHGFYLSGGSLTQEILLKSEQVYTLSMLVNNLIGSNLKVFLGEKQEDGTVSFAEVYSTGETYQGKVVHEFVANNNTVLKIENSGSASAEVTDIMLAEGKNQTVWTQANGEMYTMNVLIDKNGITVKHTDNSRTVMTPQEFAGYFNEERIFSLNGYLTEVMGIIIKKEGLHIPPIKMVQRPGVSLDIVWTGG